MNINVQIVTNISFNSFFEIEGKVYSELGYPTTRIRKGLSLSGLFKILFKKSIGAGVYVNVAIPS